MEYPNLVYKDVGSHKRPGGTYSYRAVNSDADLEAAKKLGWFLSMGEMIKGLVDEETKTVVKPKQTKKPKKPKQEEPKQEAQNDKELLDVSDSIAAAAAIVGAMSDIDEAGNDSGLDEGE